MDLCLQRKQTTDKDGKVSYEYDTDKIYKAASDFVDSYNRDASKEGAGFQYQQHLKKHEVHGQSDKGKFQHA